MLLPIEKVYADTISFPDPPGLAPNVNYGVEDLVYLIIGILITILIECTLVLILSEALEYNRNKRSSVLIFCALMNLLTNPSAHVIIYLLTLSGHNGYFKPFVPVELGVILVESVLISLFLKFKISYSILLSIILNVSSFLGGTVILFTYWFVHDIFNPPPPLTIEDITR